MIDFLVDRIDLQMEKAKKKLTKLVYYAILAYVVRLLTSTQDMETPTCAW